MPSALRKHFFQIHFRQNRLPLPHFLLVISFIGFAPGLIAQVAPSATAHGLVIWVGGEYSNFQTDFDGNRIGGVGVYADIDRTPHWGAEAESRWFRLGSESGQTASNYLLGGRYRFPLKGNKLFPYAKFLAGSGVMKYPSGLGHGSYFAYAPGGGIDFRVSHRISIRVDYEYQRWPAAPGFPGVPSHGLSPNGISVGAAWRLP
jgi:opacity protein-like surface antigen